MTWSESPVSRVACDRINANVAARSPEIWVTQGYVVIQPVDIPIVGPTGRMNDHYVDELREHNPFKG